MPERKAGRPADRPTKAPVDEFPQDTHNTSISEKNVVAVTPRINTSESAAQEYPLLEREQVSGLLQVLNENIGPAGLVALDLPRIKVPSGGGLQWVVASPEGEEYTKTVEGVIVAWRNGRLYWKAAFGEGGGRKPPDCISTNAVVGVGDPGGACTPCPFSQFGSAVKGHGQACKQIKQLLLVRPHEILPHLVSVPPTSLRAAGQYFLNLASRGIPYWGVITNIKLERATNEDGIAFSKMSFAAGKTLSAADRITLDPYHRQMAELLNPAALTSEDYIVEDAPTPEEPGA